MLYEYQGKEFMSLRPRGGLFRSNIPLASSFSFCSGETHCFIASARRLVSNPTDVGDT
jgi:hypothetical protein